MAGLFEAVGTNGPCSGCEYAPDCVPFGLLEESLFRGRAYRNPPPLTDLDLALDGALSAFMKSLSRNERSGALDSSDRGTHLSAFFDLAVTGIYTNSMLKAHDLFRQPAVVDGTTVAYFPYVWMHPKRVAEGRPLVDCYLPGARREDGRDYPLVDRLAKPGGRFIGDVGIRVLKSIVRRVLRANAPQARLRDGGGLRGEFDLTITDRTHLVFAEVKAKPLISYPLQVALKQPMGTAAMAWAELPFSNVDQLSLFLGASNGEIPLTMPSEVDFMVWPIPDLTTALANDHLFLMFLDNWKRHLRGYRQWEAEPRETRWHRFGCGNFSALENGLRVEKRVANTKELPGLDRTDDIKKGAAQLLKFSRYKFECKKRAIRCVLMGNTYAETHAENYIDPLLDLKIVRSSDEAGRQEWIFDAVFSLTQNHFNSDDIRTMFDLGAIADL